MIGFLGLISTADGATTHLFSRNLKSHELSYIGIDEPREPGMFNNTNIVCAQSTSFITLRNPSQNYRAIEYRDYEVVLSQLPPDIEKFVMVNLSTHDWYLFDRSSSQKSIRNISSNEYKRERLQLVNVCSLDEFTPSGNLSDKASFITTVIITGLAMVLALVAAIILFILYITANQMKAKYFLFHFFIWMISSGQFSMVTFANILFLKYGMDKDFMHQIPISPRFMLPRSLMAEFMMPLLLTLFNWWTTVPTMMIMFLEREKTEHEYLVLLNQRKSILWCSQAAVLPILVGIGTSSYISDISIMGRDNVSLKTAHSYVNTLVGSFNDIQLRIKLM
jgi:ABC-type sugar transport system permease subunit